MPYLVIQTNVAISQEQHAEVMAKASRAMAEALGKPESYVMIALQPAVPMLFAGSDKPCAYLALKSIDLPHAGTWTDKNNTE